MGKVLSLPFAPLRGLVIFPGELVHFEVKRAKTITAAKSALSEDSMVFASAQRDLRKEEIELGDMCTVGTICKIRQVLRIPGDSYRVLAEGHVRGSLSAVESGEECLLATVEPLDDEGDESDADYEAMQEALRRRISERFNGYYTLSSRINNDVFLNIEAIEDNGLYADSVAAQILTKFEDRQQVLEATDIIERLSLVMELVGRELDILRLDKRISTQVRKQIDKSQRDYYLREQIRAINKELGESEDSIADEYRERLAKKEYPKAVAEKLNKEIDRLGTLPPSSHEAPVYRNYIECMLDLPWTEKTDDNLSVENARAVLDADHYGLKKVKDRIVEQIAVASLTGEPTGQILCLVGPPGVGKTSICKSIASALGRKFARMSLGGVKDESEIRGHRRTYIGAMPGRIINAMRSAGTINPLMLFDEIDKLSSSYNGDPASAMLEVLDSAQNNEFKDHFLDFPYDLSKVLFITTANSLDTIPPPLRDRMEIITVDGYMEDEKLEIAQRHLMKKQLEKHGLTKGMLSLSEPQMRTIINSYTAEAGVRELERTIAAICRKAACEIVDGEKRVRMNKQRLAQYLGQPKYRHEMAEDIAAIGLVNGLAWTSVGGQTLEVEAQLLDGTGKLQLTGKLGEVMQESAQAAMTYVRSIGIEYGITYDFFIKHDIHIHVPEGATPKDGPSAGVTMATAIFSAFTGTPVKARVAMTGEVTLRGRVLAVGGLNEKLLAAVRAGIHTVIVPEANRKDIDEVPAQIKDALKLVYASSMDTVLKHALVDKREAAKKQPATLLELPLQQVHSTSIVQ